MTTTIKGNQAIELFIRDLNRSEESLMVQLSWKNDGVDVMFYNNIDDEYIHHTIPKEDVSLSEDGLLSNTTICLVHELIAIYMDSLRPMVKVKVRFLTSLSILNEPMLTTAELC